MAEHVPPHSASRPAPATGYRKELIKIGHIMSRNSGQVSLDHDIESSVSLLLEQRPADTPCQPGRHTDRAASQHAVGPLIDLSYAEFVTEGQLEQWNKIAGKEGLSQSTAESEGSQGWWYFPMMYVVPRDDEFTINLDQIGLDGRTAVMIKNIPNKYSQALLLGEIDEQHKGLYDFFYLPIDSKNKCNVGYAFINFINTEAIRPFYYRFNGRRWRKFNSEKVCELKYARMQGRQSLLQHFKKERTLK